VWVVLATIFTRHESLQLFPMGLLQKNVHTKPTHSVLSCKQKLKLVLKRSQITCCVTQFTTVWFIHSESTRSKDPVLNMCSHKDHCVVYLPCHIFPLVFFRYLIFEMFAVLLTFVKKLTALVWSMRGAKTSKTSFRSNGL